MDVRLAYAFLTCSLACSCNTRPDSESRITTIPKFEIAGAAKQKIPDPKQRSVSFFATPKFQEHSPMENYRYHTLNADGRSIVWPPKAPKPSSLNADVEYQFDLIEVESPLASIDDTFDAMWIPMLVKIQFDGNTLYDASTCTTHGTGMNRELVPVSYGLPDFRSSWYQAMTNEFPNFGHAPAGCVVGRRGDKSWAWACDTCKTNLQNRIIANP